MDEVPRSFRPCLSCTRSCYNEHWPCPDKNCLRPPCFVKALCDSNLSAMATCWMVIPSAWLKLYGDEVGNSAILHGPSGNTWQVGVGRPKWVAFRVGWRTFAADNFLEKGDMLVFTLIGNSEFSVQIFDSRTCLEKESSLSATNTGCYDSRSPVIFGEKRKQKDDDENPSEVKRLCLHENEEGNNDLALKSLRNGNSLQQSWSKLSSCSSAAQISQGECTLLDLNSKPLFIRQNAASDSAGSFPEANNLVVDVDTLQKYPSGIVYQPHPISMRSHDIGEVCSPQEQFKAQECGSGGLGPATRFASQRRPVMDGTRDRPSEFAYRQNNSSALMPPEHISHTLDSNREHFAQAIGPQILSPAVTLERGKALELARRAQDVIDRPSHMVVLRAFHVHGRAFVRFPVTFGKQHMPRKTCPMHLLDPTGHRWPMTWLRDNETHMGLTRGWRDFCLAEGLSEGDVCIFELIELNKLTLLIHVFRSSETRCSRQVVVTRSKLLDLSHVGHSIHKKLSGRKKVFEGEARGLRREVSLGGEVQLPATSGEQQSFMPSKLVLYNAFHKTRLPRLPSTVRSIKECNRCENSTAGSVGRERLKRLSFWSGEQACRHSSQRGFSQETYSFEGPHLQTCGNDDVEFIEGNMSKAQATTYGEILCQMSSGCGNANSTTTKWNIGIIGDNGKAHTFEKLERDGQHSHVEDCMKKPNGSWRPEQQEGVKHARNEPKQWSKTRKRYCTYDKADKKGTSGWTWCASSTSTFKRKLLASNQNPRIYLASRRSTVTESQKEAAKAAALALNTANPSALVVMKKPNVYRTYILELPSSFSRQLSSDERVYVFLLDAVGQKTKALLTENALTSGWRQFSLDHLLEEGDVCVFELMDVSQLIILVHIFRVVDVDHRSGSYRHHYRIISPGKGRWGVRGTWETQSDGDVVKKIASRTFQTRRSISKNLYLAIQKTIAKHSETRSIGNKWFCRTKRSDLNLNLDEANIRTSVPNAPCDSPRRKIPTSCSPISKLTNKPSRAKEITSTHEQSPIFGVHSCVLGISPSTGNIHMDTCETSNETRQLIASVENEKMLMPSLDDEYDSEPEEENYYRVIRILKKRYFQDEKQYLTELDGPVMQSDGCGGVWEYDDMNWWVPENFFSSGFSSCYLR